MGTYAQPDPYASIATQPPDPYAAIATSATAALTAPPAIATPQASPAPTPVSAWQALKNRVKGNLDYNLSQTDGGYVGDVSRGAMKEVLGLTGGAINLFSKFADRNEWYDNEGDYLQTHPGSTPQQARDAVLGKGADLIAGKAGTFTDDQGNPVQPYRSAQHQAAAQSMKDSADWMTQHAQTSGFWEGLGGVVPDVAALMTTDGLGALAGGGEAAESLSAVDKLKKMAGVGKMLEDNPRLAKLVGVGIRTAHEAAKAGLQTAGLQYVKSGGDEDATERAGIEGAATGGVLGLAGEGIGAAGKWLAGIAPTTRTIAGVDIPVLASQEADASNAARSAANIRQEPALQRTQQAAGQQVFTNMAQQATHDALSDVNAARAMPLAETNPARMLPAPADMEPYRFSINGTEPTETVTNGSAEGAGKVYAGQISVPNESYSPEAPDTDYRPGQIAAQRAQAGSIADVAPGRIIEGEPGNATQQRLGNRASLMPRRLVTGEPTRMTSNFQELPPAANQGSVIRGGGGPLTTSDPAVARAQLSQWQAIADSPSFANAPQSVQQRVQGGIDSLTNQLSDYESYQRTSPHFPQVDVDGAVSQVQNFQDAANQIKAAHQPVYAKLDELSQGRFSAIRSQLQALRGIIRNPTTDTAYDSAIARRASLRGEMQDIFTSNPTQISPQELTRANEGWKLGSTAEDLHDAIESTMNGISPQVAADTGISRTMKGGTPAYKRFSKLLADRGDDVRNLIGQGGVNNLYNVADLLKTPEKAQELGGLVSQISGAARRHGTSIAMLTGAFGAHAIGSALGDSSGGIGLYGAGALSGAVAEAGYRKVMHTIATNPEVAQRVVYALKNRVSSRVSAPLIASMLSKTPPPKEQQPAQEPQQ
jgi:hypothetical protein